MNERPKVTGELAPEHTYSIGATKHTLGSFVPKLAFIKNPPQTEWIHEQFKLPVYPGNRPRLFGHLTGRELFNAIVDLRPWEVHERTRCSLAWSVCSCAASSKMDTTKGMIMDHRNV